MRHPDFFVVGAERSGTTLVRTLLESHPEVALTPETHFIPRALGADSATEALELMLAHRRWTQFDLDDDALRAFAAEPGRTPVDVVCRLFEEYADERPGVRLLGDKTPNYAEHVPLLATTFPAARFLHVVRAPQPVVSSVLRTGWTWGPKTAHAAALRRGRHVAAARRDGRALGERYREVRYEDLVADPQGVLDGLLAWLGVEEPSLRRDRSAVAAGVTSQVVDPGSHTNLQKSVKDRSTWRDDLSLLDRAQVFVVTVEEEDARYWSLQPWQVPVAVAAARGFVRAANVAMRARRVVRG